jgi:hypothetical protein
MAGVMCVAAVKFIPFFTSESTIFHVIFYASNVSLFSRYIESAICSLYT